MTFSKRFNKFLKSEQCKMIGCIFLVLLASIMIKLSMPSTFEHLNYTFKLKFKADTPPSDPPITEFDFEIDGTKGVITTTGDTPEISFANMTEPTNDIKLIVSGNTERATASMQKLTIAGKSGTPGAGSDQNKYTYNIPKSAYTDGKPITMTTDSADNN
jgi:hypothetical protein